MISVYLLLDWVSKESFSTCTVEITQYALKGLKAKKVVLFFGISNSFR